MHLPVSRRLCWVDRQPFQAWCSISSRKCKPTGQLLVAVRWHGGAVPRFTDARPVCRSMGVAHLANSQPAGRLLVAVRRHGGGATSLPVHGGWARSMWMTFPARGSARPACRPERLRLRAPGRSSAGMGVLRPRPKLKSTVHLQRRGGGSVCSAVASGLPS